MEDKYIEDSVKELVEDLKKKVEDLTAATQGSDEKIAESVNMVRDKAVKVFCEAAQKASQMAEEVKDDEEFNKAIAKMKVKSKELYENALEKINELKSTAASVDLKDTAESVKNNIDEFMNREEVKKTVDNAKLATVEIAEKALETLKGWLMPDGEEK